jgi:hypothetical protein
MRDGDRPLADRLADLADELKEAREWLHDHDGAAMSPVELASAVAVRLWASRVAEEAAQLIAEGHAAGVTARPMLGEEDGEGAGP